jgi:hypothetical protein
MGCGLTTRHTQARFWQVGNLPHGNYFRAILDDLLPGEDYFPASIAITFSVIA